MLRSFRLVNLLLGLVAALIASALAKTWVVPDTPVSSPAIAKPAPEVEALAYNQTARPPLAQYDLLAEKSPFKQPPPVPARSAGAAPLPPLPLLTGTILVGSERRAILNEKGKSSFYSVGQGVAGGVITEIKEDRLILKRGDTTAEIMLKGAFEGGGSPAVQAPSHAQPAGAVVAPEMIPSDAIDGPPGSAMTSRAEALEKQQRRMQEQQERSDKMQRKEQRKLERRQSKNR